MKEADEIMKETGEIVLSEKRKHCNHRNETVTAKRPQKCRKITPEDIGLDTDTPYT
jgi:hypothetical protein